MLTDSFEVDPSNPSQLIARVYTYLDSEQLHHHRTVYKLVDLMSDLGGLSGGFYSLILFMIGGYVTFNSEIETMLNLYSRSNLYEKIQ